MNKRNKIIYWISTLWLSLGMVSTGIVQLFHIKGEVEFILALGYPAFFLTLLGIWKILGVIAVLIPKYPILKEWAYGGFFFSMTGAVYSHIVNGHGISEIAPPTLLLVLTMVSWYFRPEGRTLMNIYPHKNAHHEKRIIH